MAIRNGILNLKIAPAASAADMFFRLATASKIDPFGNPNLVTTTVPLMLSFHWPEITAATWRLPGPVRESA